MHTLQCQCGTLRGQLDTQGIHSRVSCYCTDCRAFARFLGKADTVLDRQGGTEIFQVSQGNVRFTEGLDQLACIRLSEKGMVRWYAACCRTPIGNTMMQQGVPFIGMIRPLLDQTRLDQDFGTALAVVNTDTALGEPKPKQVGLPGVMFRFLRLLIRARLRGEHRRSPFFTPAGALVVQPTVLTPDALAALKQADQTA